MRSSALRGRVVDGAVRRGHRALREPWPGSTRALPGADQFSSRIRLALPIIIADRRPASARATRSATVKASVRTHR